MFISYEVELQIPYSIVYSNLKEISCVDLSKGKILFHMTFPYREVCDLEQYSICSKIQKASNIWKIKTRYRKNIRDLCDRKGIN